MRVVAVIPARLASTRLPRKALAEIGGEPMVVRVWRRAAAVPGIAQVLVATDAAEIRDAVRDAGGEAVLTSPRHASGTDRVAEAVRELAADLVLNIQGDEPFLGTAAVARLVAAFADGAEAGAGTLATPLSSPEALFDPSTVKVVVGVDGHALYFSRCPVPWRPGLWERAPDGSPRVPEPPPDPRGWLRHVGVYAYRPGVLARFAALAPTPAETAESLEQLRLLEHGVRVLVVAAPWDGISVDTPADLERARRRAATGAGD